MRLLWIVERFPPQKGGVAAAAGRQVTGLAARGESVDVVQLTRDLPPGEVSATRAGRAELHRVGASRRDDESLRLLHDVAAGIAARDVPDVVHGFYAGRAGYVAVELARRLNRPSAVSLRGNDVDLGRFHGGRLALLEATLGRAGALLGVSRELLEAVRLVVGDRTGLHYLPNGVDAEVFAPGGGDEPDELRGLARPLVGFFGELRFKKGLRVLAAVAEALVDGTVVAVGGGRGDEAAELSRWRASAPGASRRLVELPYRRDAARLSRLNHAMDLVVFPSLWDGMPNALLEAMACGRPVLATAVGGIRDAIVDGESGWLVPLAELERFPATVAERLGRPADERERIGAGARRRVLAHFTAEREIDGLQAIYRDLASTSE